MEIKKLKQRAKEYFEKYGLTDWKFAIGSANRVFGSCNYKTKTIRMSKTLIELNSDEEVIDTLLHEIAHALTKGKGHGREWKQKAIEIGCKPDRCYGDNVVTPKKKYTLECPKCKRQIQRDRIRDISCGKCSEYYNPDYRFRIIK